ncbi:MAG: RNase adapter RapZ [Gemmatimonas sp.]
MTAGSEAPRPNLIITGMSGAGRSSSLKVLEDIGFEAVDNLPLALLESLFQRRGRTRPPLAVGVDARAADFDPVRLNRIFARRRKMRGTPLRLLFLDASNETLARRFKETRRKHPLGTDRPVQDAIRRERALLGELRAAADEIIDTTDLAPPALRRLLTSRFGTRRDGTRLSVVSFAYRRGLPADADLVFDVRFLDNPHYDAALRPLTGRDRRVGGRIAKDPGYPRFFKTLTDFLAVVLPRFESDGKSDLTIAIGCTGGRHRSVYVAEQVGRWLAARGRAATVRHRDLDAESTTAPRAAIS